MTIADGSEGSKPHDIAGLDSWASHRLHESEYDALRHLAEKAGTDPYRNLPAFTQDALEGWNALTPRTRARVGSLADGSSTRPELYITNLPRNETLEPTPSTYHAGRTTAGTLSEYLMMVLSVGLGYPISYADQRDGNIFHDVFPTRRNTKALSSQSSTVTLGFHTEMFFHPVAPDFLILHCLRADPDRRAVTSIASLADIEAGLDAAAREVLRQPDFAVELAGLHGSYTYEGRKIGREDPRPEISVVNTMEQFERFRFEPALMTPLTVEASRVLHSTEASADDVAAHGRLESDTLLLIDNRRAAHSRSSFTARFDGTDRWLRRMMLRQGPKPRSGFIDQPDLELAHAWGVLGTKVNPVVPCEEVPARGKEFE
ncbi:TauD/TfdA family dioxygenase [Streptomyces sp. NBC_01298]|uniref:TauD/TfdA family dioxygenase n=1 Tax=Streptomyces sp. NBC_01298 TaxID=2903817 RepID=UPI002E0D0E92|nr:TauD/TfdA family dioxygenase [Streptomyces sp. NBC_01298]